MLNGMMAINVTHSNGIQHRSQLQFSSAELITSLHIDMALFMGDVPAPDRCLSVVYSTLVPAWCC